MGRTLLRSPRSKLSTTVSAKTMQFLEDKVSSGEAGSIAEAIDHAIGKVRALENRHRLLSATTRYFDEMEAHAAREESDLARDLSVAASTIDFEHEL